MSSIADLEIRLSGGGSNTDPNLSVGGVMSSHVVRNVAYNGDFAAQGITLLSGSGADLEGKLLVVDTLTEESGSYVRVRFGSPSPGDENINFVETPVAGRYNIGVQFAPWTAAVLLYVDPTLFSGSNTFNLIPVVSPVGTTFLPDIRPFAALTGQIVWSCVFLKNHAADALTVEVSLADVGTPAAGIIKGMEGVLVDTDETEVWVLGDTPDYVGDIEDLSLQSISISLAAGQSKPLWLGREVTGGVYADATDYKKFTFTKV